MAAVIGGKLVIDMAFRVWTVRRFRRWIGDSRQTNLASAAASALIEPFTFNLLLQAGAVLGWVAFLGGAQRWGTQQRFGALGNEPPPDR